MNEQQARVACVGEAIMEFTRGEDGRFVLGFGGDTFHTAVYLARSGIATALVTALGDDPYSDTILSVAAAEGVACDLVLRAAGRLPGLRLADKDPGGAPRTYEWRDAAPARELFEFGDWPRLAEGLLTARLIYFSGTTLSLYSNTGLGRFLAILEMARQAGIKIAFDSNFRLAGWKGDIARARTVFIETLKRVDWALPAFADEAALWGDTSPQATIERIRTFGIAEVAVKNGRDGALIAAGDTWAHVPVPEIVESADRTAAGAGFNAGYLAARLAGHDPLEAAAAAHRLAAQVIRHPAAMMPRLRAAVH